MRDVSLERNILSLIHKAFGFVIPSGEGAVFEHFHIGADVQAQLQGFGDFIPERVQ